MTTHGKRLTLLSLVFLLVLMALEISIADCFEGKWRHTELIELDASEADCRVFKVITRTYDLTENADGSVSGLYAREYRLLWVGPANDCAEEFNPEPGSAIGSYRIDGWQLRGAEYRAEEVEVEGHYSNCVGDCDNDAFFVDSNFRTTLFLRSGYLVDVHDDDYQFVFLPNSLTASLEREAAEKMFKLIVPLYEGKCNQFYEDNLDPQVKSNFPRTEFCRVVQRLGRLMPEILYHNDLTAIYFAVARFARPPMKEELNVWGGLDVFVEQMFVVRPDGGSVPVAAVLRKQSDGSWKVLMPTP